MTTPATDTSLVKSIPSYGSFTAKLSAPCAPLGTQDTPKLRPTAEQLIATEKHIASLWREGKINSLLHLEGSVDGSYEQFMCDFFQENIRATDFVLASHRSHFVYQLHWGTDVVEQVLRGRSMFLHSQYFLSSAIVAGAASIAVGIALANQRKGSDQRVFVFGGDGCENHGHWQEAVVYSWQKGLNLHWIITDNDSSCGVTKRERNGSDRMMTWPDNVTRFKYTALYPHAGTLGEDGKPDRPPLKP